MSPIQSRKVEPLVEIPGFRLVRELAAGSSARVFLAIQESLQREVAIKLLAPGLFDAEETRTRFLREAKVQARLNHPAILSVMDAGFVGKHPFLVLEVVEGGSLRNWLAKAGGKAPLLDSLRVGAEIAAGLDHAHSKGIIHRDLKPENVLMTADGRAKLADFGLARQLSEAPRTAAGVVLGTPGYVAPEVLEGAVASTAADMYALGSILYELFTGRLAFDGDSIGETIRQQLSGPPARPAQVESELPALLDKLVMDCLDVEPGGRPSAAEAAKALESARMSRVAPRPPAPRSSQRRLSATDSRSAATTVLGSRPSSATIVSGVRPVPKRRRPWLLGGAVVALLLMTLVTARFRATRRSVESAATPAAPASAGALQPSGTQPGATAQPVPHHPEAPTTPREGPDALNEIMRVELARLGTLRERIGQVQPRARTPRFQVPAALARGHAELLGDQIVAVHAAVLRLARIAQNGDRTAAACAGLLVGECAIAAKLARGAIWKFFHPHGEDPELLLATVTANARTDAAIGMLDAALAARVERLSSSLPDEVPTLRDHPACLAGMAALMSLQRSRRLGRADLARLNERVVSLVRRALPGIAARGDPGRQNVVALRHARTALEAMGAFEVRRALLQPAREALAAPGPELTPIEVLLRFELEADLLDQQAPTIEMAPDPVQALRGLMEGWVRLRDGLLRRWPYNLLKDPPSSAESPSVAAALPLHQEAVARLREADQEAKSLANRQGLPHPPPPPSRRD